MLYEVITCSGLFERSSCSSRGAGNMGRMLLRMVFLRWLKVVLTTLLKSCSSQPSSVVAFLLSLRITSYNVCYTKLLREQVPHETTRLSSSLAYQEGEFIDILKRNACSPGYALKRIFCNNKRNRYLFRKPFIQASHQRTTTCEVDTPADNISI